MEDAEVASALKEIVEMEDMEVVSALKEMVGRLSPVELAELGIIVKKVKGADVLSLFGLAAQPTEVTVQITLTYDDAIDEEVSLVSPIDE